MRIDRISNQPDRSQRYTVTFSGGKTMRLYRQTIEDFGLFTGMELDDAQMEKLRIAANKMSAKMRAVRIVSATSVSKSDLQRRLVMKGEDPICAKEAVDWMSELNLLDDEKTAEMVVSRCAAKGYGLARAKQALYEKRIPKSCWDKALEDYPDQSESIRSYLQARISEDADEKTVRKAIDALIRRGHSYGDIRAVLNRLNITDRNDWD